MLLLHTQKGFLCFGSLLCNGLCAPVGELAHKRVYYYCYYSEAMFHVFEEWDSSVVRAPDS